ncbi:Sec-independent protein translocase subunit TatA [Actinacidiphila sp. DG2A-62]|jgi:sec-independent protein translocase protein TatA|uniref:Sec-independent protein translocase subunit TatA n=1 Tax=Actinacidiphila sp. DG2A-62 TaxID=3108821 RepID=UPI002DBE0124|nr:Sec-independent protein translocase subunit TatA [Actinacidiphila sp. DG2A-62]MEC3993107.1 Sec-independent protein translocase subunit TatA [Actinacidiphila sp. DG2A-62]
MLGNLKPLELVLILLVVVLVFGAKKLPDVARSLGKSARILKSEAKAMKNDGSDGTAESTAAQPAAETPRTIQSAPGDTASARPVQEPADRAARG